MCLGRRLGAGQHDSNPDPHYGRLTGKISLNAMHRDILTKHRAFVWPGRNQLERLPQHHLDFVPIAPAEYQAGAVFQHDLELAMRAALEERD